MKKSIIICLSALILVLAFGPAQAQPHFSPVTITGANYAVTVNDALIDAATPFAVNDEIGLFVDDGGVDVLVGSAVFTGSFPLGIVAYENDPSTPAKDGFDAGDAIIIRVWDASESIEYTDIGTVFYAVGNGFYGFTPYTYIALISPAIGIPTVGQWGLIILTLSMLIGGTLVMRRRRVGVPVSA